MAKVAARSKAPCGCAQRAELMRSALTKLAAGDTGAAKARLNLVGHTMIVDARIRLRDLTRIMYERRHGRKHQS